MADEHLFMSSTQIKPDGDYWVIARGEEKLATMRMDIAHAHPQAWEALKAALREITGGKQ